MAGSEPRKDPTSITMDNVTDIDLARAGAAERETDSTSPAAAYQDDFEQLIVEHQSGLIRYAYRMVKNRELAQDMVQEAFVRYIKNPPRYGLPKQRASWLFRVTHNLCIDYMKRETKRRDIYEKVEQPTEVPQPGEDLVARESWGEMERFVGELSENQQTVIYLFFQQGKSYKEIEAITDLSLSNVGMLLHRGLKKIKKRMEEEGYQPA